MGETSTTYNVSVEDELSYLDRSGPGEDFWENHGFLVRGRTADGEDLTMWLALYIVKQGGEDSYYAFQANVSQTLLTYGRYSADEKQSMHDSDFVASGWALSELLPFGSVQVQPRDGSVVWTAGTRTYVDAPPRWTIRGEHAGVDVDITMEAIAPAFWFYPFDKIPEDGIGWYEAYLRASGTVRHDGRTLEFEGYACHERIRMTRDHVPDRLKQRGLYWQHLFDDRVQCWMMASPSIDDALAHVVVDGEVFHATGADRVRVQDLASWTDPRSGFTHPHRWRVQVDTEAGTLDLVAGAYARAYYVWSPFKATTNVLQWMTADATGTFTRTDGSVIEFTSAPYLSHINRAFFETHRG